MHLDYRSCGREGGPRKRKTNHLPKKQLSADLLVPMAEGFLGAFLWGALPRRAGTGALLLYWFRCAFHSEQLPQNSSSCNLKSWEESLRLSPSFPSSMDTDPPDDHCSRRASFMSAHSPSRAGVSTFPDGNVPQVLNNSLWFKGSQNELTFTLDSKNAGRICVSVYVSKQFPVPRGTVFPGPLDNVQGTKHSPTCCAVRLGVS